ncbi:MAG: mechanosensitive ion channel family protein [Methylacidiphilales bacterium]|nr:mechanosensitive ion channel family protein [Candidatus Methylacidiphilales bacterium]MDW8348960.1 mechanosensitive ion channel family protein [Verrucomicrobiae bacterium]
MENATQNWLNILETLLRHIRPAEWFTFALFVFLGLLAFWLIDQKIVRLIRRWLIAHDAHTITTIIHLIRLPLAITILAYFTLLGLEQITSLPESIQSRLQRIYPTANLAIIIFFLYRGVDIIAVILRRYWSIQENTLNSRWTEIGTFLAKALIIGIGGMTLLQMLGIPILPMLTGAGFLGAALALASQSTLANAIGSLELIFDRPFQVGDRISFLDYDGFVTRMGIRSIEITSLTGERITLPNKDVVDKQIRNYSKTNDPQLIGCTRILLTVGIVYQHSRTEIQKACQILEEILRSHPKVKKAFARFRALAPSSLEIIGIAWADYKNGDEFFALQSELQLEIKDRFDKAGLQFAYPTQTLFIEKLPGGGIEPPT